MTCSATDENPPPFCPNESMFVNRSMTTYRLSRHDTTIAYERKNDTRNMRSRVVIIARNPPASAPPPRVHTLGYRQPPHPGLKARTVEAPALEGRLLVAQGV